MSEVKRRANGEGTVYQRKDGRWEAAVYLPTADGGTRRTRVYAPTRAEAVDKRDSLIADALAGMVSGGVTVGRYVTDWLEGVAAHRLRTTTLTTYRWYVSKFIVPGIGDIPLVELTVRDVRQWLDGVRQQCQCCVQGRDARRDPNHRRKDRRPRCCAVGQCCRSTVTHGTVLYVRAVLSAALAHAVREDQLTRNVASAVQLGQARPEPFEPLTATEARKLLKAAECNRWRVLFELALRTGLRRGELLGLRWSDINFRAGTLTVLRTLQRTQTGLVNLPTKTQKSQRRIVLPEVCLVSLREHRRRQQIEARAAGAAWANQDGLVFVTTTGQPVDPGAINDNLHAICDLAGIRRIRVHDLRHSCATLLLEQGVELVTIKELLSHAQIHTTADVYAHVRLRLQRHAIEAMNTALNDDHSDPEPDHDAPRPDHPAPPRPGEDNRQ